MFNPDSLAPTVATAAGVVDMGRGLGSFLLHIINLNDLDFFFKGNKDKVLLDKFIFFWTFLISLFFFW